MYFSVKNIPVTNIASFGPLAAFCTFTNIGRINITCIFNVLLSQHNVLFIAKVSSMVFLVPGGCANYNKSGK